MKRRVQIGDQFMCDNVRWTVKEPYKVSMWWLAVDPDGNTRVFTGGTISIFRIKEKSK